MMVNERKNAKKKEEVLQEKERSRRELIPRDRRKR